jgi:hypothetical protein
VLDALHAAAAALPRLPSILLFGAERTAAAADAEARMRRAELFSQSRCGSADEDAAACAALRGVSWRGERNGQQASDATSPEGRAAGALGI